MLKRNFFIGPKCTLKVICWRNIEFLGINFSFLKCLSKAIFFLKRYVTKPLLFEKHLNIQPFQGKKSGDVLHICILSQKPLKDAFVHNVLQKCEAYAQKQQRGKNHICT